VVSGHVRGETNTMPLQVEILYNEYNFVAAFAVASLLAALALVTLFVKKTAEWTSGVQERRRESERDQVLRTTATAVTALQEQSP
jgi:sulfate transport system permease protein